MNMNKEEQLNTEELHNALDNIQNGCSYVVVMGNAPVRLTSYEYKILLLLAAYPQKTLSAKFIYRLVWNMEDLGNPYTVCVHISNLRKKLIAAYPQRDPIVTKWKTGYQLKANHEIIQRLSAVYKKTHQIKEERK